MTPFWQNLELLPSSVRHQAREKLARSPKEYEESRAKVKEGLREGDERKEKERGVAEVLFYIEMNEEELKEKMQGEKLEDSLAEFRSFDLKQWRSMQRAFAQGKFDLSVAATGEGKPTISMQIELPEGNVTEKLPLAQALQEALTTRALQSEPSAGRKAD